MTARSPEQAGQVFGLARIFHQAKRTRLSQGRYGVRSLTLRIDAGISRAAKLAATLLLEVTGGACGATATPQFPMGAIEHEPALAVDVTRTSEAGSFY